MLRRGYNFTDGTDGLGRLDAGLFFLAFVRDRPGSTCRCRPGCPSRTG